MKHPDPVVLAVAKAISPWAWAPDTFVDARGKLWAQRRDHCQEHAVEKAEAAIAAFNTAINAAVAV